MDLAEEFKIIFKDIIDSYGFSLKMLGENELALVNGDFALWFYYYYREGVSLSYLYNDGAKVWDYKLEAYLRFKKERGWELSSSRFSDENILKIESFALTLERYAKDILSGDKMWLKDYKQHYPLTPVAPITAN